MRRADRLFSIVQHLRGGRLTTAAKLADALEVSARTIYRDIVDLQAQGVPIEGEAGYGYVLAEGYHLPPLMFSDAEIVALVAGARMLRAWGGASMAKAAEEALVKISDVLPEAARAQANAVPIYAMGPKMPDALRALLDVIEQAVEERLRLEFTYTDGKGAATTREIRALGVWFWGATWTAVGWCELRQDFRTFRLDRMANVTQGAPFKPTRDTDLRAFYAKLERDGEPVADFRAVNLT